MHWKTGNCLSFLNSSGTIYLDVNGKKKDREKKEHVLAFYSALCSNGWWWSERFQVW